MATMTVSFPDDVANRIIDALCARGSRPDDSTVPKPQFAKGVVTDWMERVTIQYEATLAGEAAHKDAADAAQDDIIIS
jgi:hypothetical protein